MDIFVLQTMNLTINNTAYQIEAAIVELSELYKVLTNNILNNKFIGNTITFNIQDKNVNKVHEIMHYFYNVKPNTQIKIRSLREYLEITTYMEYICVNPTLYSLIILDTEQVTIDVDDYDYLIWFIDSINNKVQKELIIKHILSNLSSTFYKKKYVNNLSLDSALTLLTCLVHSCLDESGVGTKIIHCLYKFNFDDCKQIGNLRTDEKFISCFADINKCNNYIAEIYDAFIDIGSEKMNSKLKLKYHNISKLQENIRHIGRVNDMLFVISETSSKIKHGYINDDYISYGYNDDIINYIKKYVSHDIRNMIPKINVIEKYNCLQRNSHFVKLVKYELGKNAITNHPDHVLKIKCNDKLISLEQLINEIISICATNEIKIKPEDIEFKYSVYDLYYQMYYTNDYKCWGSLYIGGVLVMPMIGIVKNINKYLLSYTISVKTMKISETDMTFSSYILLQSYKHMMEDLNSMNLLDKMLNAEQTYLICEQA